MKALINILSGALILTGCLVGVTAHAGYTYNGSVQVGSNWARGSVRDARDNPGSSEYIGCSYEAHQTSGGYFYCAARSPSGSYMACYQYSPSDRLLTSIQSINDSSYVEFTRDSSSRCTEVIVRNFSQYL